MSADDSCPGCGAKGPHEQSPDDPTLISVVVPRWMLEDLRAIAKSRDIEVVEHIRQCVSFDRTLAEGDAGDVFVLADGRRVQLLPPIESGSGVITKEAEPNG